ncbi:MAG: hypothetical protein MRJ93_07250 [Nitrososphaeraceae archaeon]|nr:hypothetical protein [Nitrososphaeraceae archaeon]
MYSTNVFKDISKKPRNIQAGNVRPNLMVQMYILRSFYLEKYDQKNYFISCEDDSSRQIASE